MGTSDDAGGGGVGGGGGGGGGRGRGSSGSGSRPLGGEAVAALKVAAKPIAKAAPWSTSSVRGGGGKPPTPSDRREHRRERDSDRGRDRDWERDRDRERGRGRHRDGDRDLDRGRDRDHDRDRRGDRGSSRGSRGGSADGDCRDGGGGDRDTELRRRRGDGRNGAACRDRDVGGGSGGGSGGGGGGGGRPSSKRDGASAAAAVADGSAREGPTEAARAPALSLIGASIGATAATAAPGAGGAGVLAPFPPLPPSGDKMRDRVRDLVAVALYKDGDGLLGDKSAAVPAAAAVEAAMFAATGADAGGAYKAKYRQLSFNLKDPKNVSLRRGVLCGDLLPEVLVGMSNEELANEETKAYRKDVALTMLREAQPGGNARATTDMFRCGKCKQRRTTYHQMQTRSADEPMTTFVCCLECGNRWKC